MSGAHVIDIDQLVDSVMREQNYSCLRDEGGEHETSISLIHKVNIHIRNKHKDAYAPTMLTIGPYNNGVLSVDSMKKIKYEFLDYVLHLNQEKGLPDYLEVMSKLENIVRSSYADGICMERNEFLKMLLLDGCFLLAYLCGAEGLKAELQESNECNRRLCMNEEIKQEEIELQSSSEVAHEDGQQDVNPIEQLQNQVLWHDLLLLENQIPFFVISKIQETIAGGNNLTTKFVENIIDLVEIALGCYPRAISKSNRPKEFHHLLHLCHMYFRPCSEQVESFTNQVKSHSHHYLISSMGDWHRATEYNQVGIGFEKRKYCSENPHSLLDIVFCNGTIEIPCLTIDPITKTLFCNLVAFEQTCPQFGSYVTAYVMFLSSLINMPDDVSVLTKSGIIVHQLNTDAEVCDLFKEIRECAALSYHSDNYLKPLYTRIEAHYMSKRPILRTLFSLVSTKVRSWTESSESSGTILPVTTSQETPI